MGAAHDHPRGLDCRGARWRRSTSPGLICRPGPSSRSTAGSEASTRRSTRGNAAVDSRVAGALPPSTSGRRADPYRSSALQGERNDGRCPAPVDRVLGLRWHRANERHQMRRRRATAQLAAAAEEAAGAGANGMSGAAGGGGGAAPGARGGSTGSGGAAAGTSSPAGGNGGAAGARGGSTGSDGAAAGTTGAAAGGGGAGTRGATLARAARPELARPAAGRPGRRDRSLRRHGRRDRSWRRHGRRLRWTRGRDGRKCLRGGRKRRRPRVERRVRRLHGVESAGRPGTPLEPAARAVGPGRQPPASGPAVHAQRLRRQRAFLRHGRIGHAEGRDPPGRRHRASTGRTSRSGRARAVRASTSPTSATTRLNATNTRSIVCRSRRRCPPAAAPSRPATSG